MLNHVRLFIFILFATAALDAQDSGFFETKIRPVLARDCYACHSASKQFAGLRVDSREALLIGGKRGAAIVPGKPDDSLLIKAIRHSELKMPLGGKLKDSEIAAMEEWIRRGAPWPATASATSQDRYAQLLKQHWAYQPVVKQPLSIDAAIRGQLRKSRLTAAPPADRRTLIRRLSFVLTGLPATADEADQFVTDKSPDAYRKLVDRLQASPRFGEHWARYWLDLVRYGETRGYEWNYEITGAWRYRDYMIRALNSDVPYDQLIREHVAGDLLKSPRINAAEQLNESIIGTAFYRLGEAGHDDCIQFRELATDVVDNQIDTLTKAFQGVTVSCARCHDHKIDPIPTEDYYSLYGILNSSRQVTHSIDTPAVNAQPIEKLRAIKVDIRATIAAIWKNEANSIGGKLEALPATIRMEDPAYPLTYLNCETAGLPEYFADSAAKLAARYQREAAARAEFNAKNYQPFDGWKASGMGLRNGVTPAGSFAIARDGDAALKAIYPSGQFTHLDSEQLNGALRSQNLPKNKKFISLQVMGGRLGARRTVIDNCAIGENYKLIENDKLEWLKLETFDKQERLPVFMELVTRFDNPRIPDRPGMLKANQEKWAQEPRSYFGFTKAVLHDVAEPPRAELGHMLPLFSAGPPRTRGELIDRYVAHIRTVIDRWSQNNSTDEDVLWLDWLLRNNLLTNQKTPSLAPLIDEYHRIEATLQQPRVIDGMADIGPGRDTQIFVAGDPKSFGAPAPRRLLKRILGDSQFNSQGSGRMELAEKIANPQNPLTARLMVNRIWHQVFGRGIVATVDNLGVLGDRPSHPELLDALATNFVEQGWSIKKLIRTMVLSETFQQSGATTPAAREQDPQNTLLSHYPLRRLSAESLRDGMLLASGKLNEQLYGPSIDPHRDEAKDYRRLFSGPLDGNGRRSLYTKITRMEGAKFLETFDYPSPMATRGSRDVTNVPLQALTMMNDPFVIAEAESFAKRVMDRRQEERLAALFRIALNRTPTAAEQARFTGLAAELASLNSVPKDSLDVWKNVAHAILNLKEFLYFQ